MQESCEIQVMLFIQPLLDSSVELFQSLRSVQLWDGGMAMGGKGTFCGCVL